MKKVVLIGAGNVAWQLAHFLPFCGCAVVQVFSRTEESASTLSNSIGAEHTTNLQDLYDSADFYIYAVTDNSIEAVVRNMRELGGTHMHTSGSVDITVFENKFENYGAMYMLQTFSKNKKIDFGKVPIFVEANNQSTLDNIYSFSKKISLKVYKTDFEQRRKLHLTGVFSANFPNYFWNVANNMLKTMSLQFNDVLMPLVEESVDKLRYMSAEQAQTGPAIRGDSKTIESHLLSISNKKIEEIYRLISENIQQKTTEI